MKMLNLKHWRPILKFTRSQSIKANSCHQESEPQKHKFLLSRPLLDEDYLLDCRNTETISANAKLRKGVGDIHLVHDLHKKLNESLTAEDKTVLEQQIQDELKRIPNETHPEVRNYGDEPKIVSFYNEKQDFKHKPLEFSEICKKMNLLRTDHLGNFAGHKSFFLMSDLAELVSKETFSAIKMLKQNFVFQGASSDQVHDSRNP